MGARRRARRDVCQPVPRTPDLYDGGSAQYRPLYAFVVHCKEHRADRRPRHQYCRECVLPGARHSARAGTTEGRQIEPRSRRARAPTWPGRSAMKPLVLIVEDEVPLVTMLRYNLEREGFAVDAAADGEEALLRIAEQRPDAVRLDWMLPLVSGLEVCRQIRRASATRSLPVIMLTARGAEGDRIRGLDRKSTRLNSS